jgi:hypothetical protein
MLYTTLFLPSLILCILQSFYVPFRSEPWSQNYHTVFFSGDVVAESYAFIIISVRVVLLVANNLLVPAFRVYKQFFVTEVDLWAAAGTHKAICCLIEP